MPGLRCLTIHQPHANLIAAGAKTIETRSWRTAYRGWVAIHASMRLYTAADKHADRDLFFAAHDVLELERSGGVYLLPYGEVVAVARLTDCVPMVHATQPRNGHCLVVGLHRLVLHGDPTEPGTDITDQQPLGDFEPDRYAWLLDDIRPLPDPIAARGRQGLWTPDDDLTAAILQQTGELVA